MRDLDAKARLEAAMDERRTGEDGYRRRLAQARDVNPQRPGRPIDPFGVTKLEEETLLKDSADHVGPIKRREAMGVSVRRYTNTGGRTSIRPSRESTPATPR